MPLRKVRLWNPQGKRTASRRRRRFPAYSRSAGSRVLSNSPLKGASKPKKGRGTLASGKKKPLKRVAGRWQYGGRFVTEGRAKQIQAARARAAGAPAHKAAAKKAAAKRTSKKGKKTVARKPKGYYQTGGYARARARSRVAAAKKAAATRKRNAAKRSAAAKKAAATRKRNARKKGKAVQGKAKAATRRAAARRSTRRARPQLKGRVTRKRRNSSTRYLKTKSGRRRVVKAWQRDYNVRRKASRSGRHNVSLVRVHNNDALGNIKKALTAVLPTYAGLMASRIGANLLTKEVLAKQPAIAKYAGLLSPAAIMLLSAVVVPKVTTNPKIKEGLLLGSTIALLDQVVKTVVAPQLAKLGGIGATIGGALSGYTADPTGYALPSQYTGAISDFEVQQALAEYTDDGMGLDVTEALADYVPGLGGMGALTGNVFST